MFTASELLEKINSHIADLQFIAYSERFVRSCQTMSCQWVEKEFVPVLMLTGLQPLQGGC